MIELSGKMYLVMQIEGFQLASLVGTSGPQSSTIFRPSASRSLQESPRIIKERKEKHESCNYWS